MFTDPIQFNYNVKLETPIEKQDDSKTRKTLYVALYRIRIMGQNSAVAAQFFHAG